MSTRFFIVTMTIFLLLGYTGVHAGDFSMHTGEFGSPAASHDAGMDIDRAESDFSIGHELSSRNLRNESNSARITPSGRSYGAGASTLNTPSSGDEDSQPSTQLGDSAGSARATLPGAASTPAQKARAGNRWQSLVPGAIK